MLADGVVIFLAKSYFPDTAYTSPYLAHNRIDNPLPNLKRQCPHATLDGVILFQKHHVLQHPYKVMFFLKKILRQLSLLMWQLPRGTSDFDGFWRW